MLKLRGLRLRTLHQCARQGNSRSPAAGTRGVSAECPCRGPDCQGSGLNVPDEFVQALSDLENGFSEDDYIGLFDEVKFPENEQKAPTSP